MEQTMNNPKGSALHPPDIARLKKLSDQLNLGISKEKLHEYQDLLSEWTRLYQELENLPDPDSLTPKYPRPAAYRPEPEENKYNAWYWKADIKGATSGKLHGRKLAVKDNIAVAGVPMMNGSKLMEGYVPEFDATVVTRVLDAGGVIVGKAVCEDMSLACNSFTSATGPMSNPWNPTCSAGGSSSGCAVLVSSGEVDMAMGADQGGSIRAPAACTGIVGLKPTYGLVPYTGIYSIEWRVDHTGPMARTVKDCALLLEVVAGYDDGLDPRQPPNIVVPQYTDALNGDLKEVKVGLLEEGFSLSEEEVSKVVKDTALRLKGLGALVEEVSIPLHKKAQCIGEPACYIGAYENTINNHGFLPGMKGFNAPSWMKHMKKGVDNLSSQVQPMVKASMLFGAYIKEEYGNYLYGKAVNMGRELTKEYNQVLQKYDVLILPTKPNIARKLPSYDVKVKDFYDAACADLCNTQQFDISGHPAISVNAGFLQGLPVGLMVVGKHFDETMVFRVAHGVEKVREGGEIMPMPPYA